MRLIDTDALYQKIADKIYKDCNALYGRYCRVEDILQDIEYTSTVVDLVFCKDCLYFIEYGDKYKPVEGAFGVCWKKMQHSTSNQFIVCQENDFCSYGKIMGR